jgi:hypothetical protein
MTNAGTVVNRGVELSLNYRDRLRSSFYYDLTFNISTLHNEVLALGGTDPYITGEVAFNVLSRTQVGSPIGEWFLLKSNGIYQIDDPDLKTLTILGKTASPGDYKYIDIDGDNNITAEDAVDCGSPWPKVEYSFQCNFKYRAWDLSMYFYGNIGRKVYNSLEYSLTNTASVDGNFRAGLVNDCWTEDNPNAKYSMIRAGSTIISYTDRYLQDGSFLRLSNLQIGFDVNSLIHKKDLFGKLRAYVGVENLFTITKYTGWNVDFKGFPPFLYGYDGNTYPVTLNILSGIQLTF